MRDSDGRSVKGQITSDAGGWSLIPGLPWQAGQYLIVVDPELEDIAGNTIGVPFDASPGTIGNQTTPAILTINITAS